MEKNYDFLRVEESKQANEERILLSTKIWRFDENDEKSEMILLITKQSLVIESKTEVIRDIFLSEIEAITYSKNSSEFIIHLEDDYDERLLSYKTRKEIIEILLYVLTTSVKNKLPVYFVSEINLDIFTTTEEDLDDGHTIRPEDKDKLYMDYQDFLAKENKIKEKKINNRKSTRTLFSRNNKKVTRDDFELLKLLGKGAHGKVLLCEKISQTKKKEYFAMKILKKQHIIEAKQLEHTKAEKIILSYVNHPFLVSLKYSFQSGSKIYFIMEFMKGGELFQHLRKVRRFTENQTKFITACLVLAIGHLHNKDYIYRDLKPENILLDSKGYAKLTDFGLAKFLKIEDRALTFCGTPEYLAPEVILDKGCNRPADWWSLGILVYEMIYGIPPFYSRSVQKMYKNTIKKGLKFKKGIECSDEGKDFIAGLLIKKSENRLGSVADSLEVMNHPWFQDFEWHKLLDKKLEPPYKPIENEKNWIKNFDPNFTAQNPTDSICFIDPSILDQFKKDFEEFDFEPEKDSTSSDEIEADLEFRNKSFSLKVKTNSISQKSSSLEKNYKKRINSTPKKMIDKVKNKKKDDKEKIDKPYVKILKFSEQNINNNSKKIKKNIEEREEDDNKDKNIKVENGTNPDSLHKPLVFNQVILN